MPKRLNIKRMNAFVFIDGNNLYHNLKKMKIKPKDLDLLKLSKVVCSHFNCNHKWSFYYNSIPSIKDGRETYHKHMSYLNDVGKLPKFTVKTRKLQRTSTAEARQEKREILNTLDLCDKCRPLIEATCEDCIGNIKKKEKGIDVMIAVDMIDLCLIKDKCDCCVLISGDADFLPAINILRKDKKKVFSTFLRAGYSYNLREQIPFFILNRALLVDECLK